MTSALTLETLWQTLGTILDPEFGLSIVDLGLVYDVVLEGDRVSVKMTLTSPACPASGMIVDGTRAALVALPGAASVDVSLVWEPPWTPERLTRGGRDQLGWIESDA